MNIHIYRQTDSRWSSLAYPTASSSFGANGCGACSILHCIIEMDKYKKWTPKNVQPYMKQYAVNNQGTTWAGIPAAMKHYGLKNVKNVATMSDLWKECKKGNRVGVLLFGTDRGPDGTVWTLGGHYIAFVDYKYEKDQHWLYLKDSGDRKHDKWWSYEKSMKGDVRQVWVGTLPDGHTETVNKYADSLKKTGYTGTLPTNTVGRKYGTKTEIKNWQKFLNWWYGFKLDVDGIFGDKSEKATIEFQDAHGLSADGIAGSKTLAKAKNYKAKATTTTTTTTTKTTTTTTTSTSAADQKTTAKFTKEKVIDVSYVQSNPIDWAKVKKAGIAGVIVRCGYRGYESAKLSEDSMFMNHITGANKAGLKLGIYFFTEAINAAEGRAEAQFAIKMLKKAGVKLTYPIAIDTENINGSPTPRANSTVLSKAKRTEAIKAFCEEIKANGYEPMIYASTSWLNNQLDMSKLPYTVWVAQYNDSVTYKGSYALWQYTSTNKVDGITNKSGSKVVVDTSYCYVDYANKTQPAATPTKTTTLKSIDVVAQEVLDGKWGAGETRKKKLTEAGYDYEAVQKKVNELLTPPLKSIDEIAQEVLDGKWGAGQTRKTKLVEAGYDYDKVQAKVNEIIAAQLAEEEAKQKAEEEAKKKAEEEAKRKAEEEAEAKRKAEEEAEAQLNSVVETIASQYDTSTLTKIVEKLLEKLEKLNPSTPSVEPEPEPVAQTPKKYDGTFPSLTLKKSTTQVITDSIKWAKWIAGDNSFHYGYTNSDKSINAHHNGCYFCGTNVTSGGRSKKGIVDYKKTYCCNPFTGASWAHGGGDQTALGLCQKGSSWDYHKGKGYDTSSKFKKLGHPAKSELKPGDVLCRDTHVAQYIGDGKIVEAGAGDDNVRNSTKWNNSIRVKELTDSNYANFPRVYRYTGSVNATCPILHGEVSYRVADMQRFLNWYFDGALGTIDGIFGDNTLKYLKTFQTARKIAVTGQVDANTIAEMKKVEK